ncbi:alkaline phosphatase [Phenylobacterium sp.]|uniref:alkaline phosphatase D family protein n=1 Tax=Phenylobacterium sp. TaxID=1871053 RepID=UPI003567841F
MLLNPYSRRAVMGGLAAAVAAPALVRAQTVSETPFTLGIASGDPSPDGFVIWTRLAPRPLELHSGMRMTKATVAWEVAADERFATILAKGETIARPELGHSVHVEVGGLMPNRSYWYRFTSGGATSTVGRARTLPALASALDRVRFIAGGCQNYEAGYFTAYRRIAEEPDVDFFWHYGDYIYEGTGFHAPGSAAPVRVHHADEPYSLDDYRARYAQYKLDPDMQAAHAAHTWWVTWDDHETDNNWASQFDQDGTPPEIFNLRRQASAQAYYENMPLRRSSFPHGTAIQIFRQASYGDLLDCWFLDTRQFRDDQPCGDGGKPVCPEALDPKRTIMGAEEEAWLLGGLAKGKRRWNLIANQVMMMPLDRRQDDGDPPLWNMDSWAGYPAARKRLLDHIQKQKIGNVVIATGDEHQNFAGELRTRVTEGPALATEFLGTSITSAGDGVDLSPRYKAVLAHNPHCPFINSQRGYVVHDVGREHWQAEFKVLDHVSRPDGKLSTRAKFAVERGKPGLHAA